MSEQLFGNNSIISWLQYYVDNMQVDLEKVKILDITRKNKNLIPTVEANNYVMVFTEAGHHDIFYRMWDVGLGDCEVWYNDGSEPSGPIRHDRISDMINRGINASAAMLIVNPGAVSTYKIGMKNTSFSKGSVQYVGSELRAVILNKMHVSYGDTICIISGESIAVESAILAHAAQVLIDHVDDETLSGLPVPSLTMMVASASTEQEIRCLLKINPCMEFVIYTLDFRMAAGMSQLFEKYNIRDMETIQVTVSKAQPNNLFQTEPAPWIITGRAGV